MPSFSHKDNEVLRAGAVARQLIPAIWAGALLLVLLHAVPALAQETARGAEAYRAFPLFGSRLAVWGIAQIHLNFAAFILGVPIFAVIVEVMGMRTKDPRYDWLAHQFVKLVFAAFSTTALLGALLLFLFISNNFMVFAMKMMK